MKKARIISRARVFNQSRLPSLNRVFWLRKPSNREANLATWALINWDEKERSESSREMSRSFEGRRQRADKMSDRSKDTSEGNRRMDLKLSAVEAEKNANHQCYYNPIGCY